VGFTCAECPRGTFASLEGRCAQCAEGNQALWMTLGCEMVVMLEDLRNCWLVWVDLLKCDVFIFLKSHVMFLIFYFSVTESIGGNEALLVVVPLVIACDSGFVSIKVM